MTKFTLRSLALLGLAAAACGNDQAGACDSEDCQPLGQTNPCETVVCKPLDECHDAGDCDPSTGQCTNPTKADGTTCSDGDACTQTDTCQSGSCTGANPVVCSASDQCHDAGQCNAATGTCSNPAKADGSTCSDGNTCTETDTCLSGSCAGSAISCAPADQCHLAGVCEPSTGECTNPAITTAGTLDQSQFNTAGTLNLTTTQEPGQSFTVGRTGVLLGIEVQVGPCNADTSGQIMLELFDSEGSVGSATIQQNSLPNVCGGNPLSPDSTGPGYFDLSSLCLEVTEGDSLRFELSLLLSGPGATCDLESHLCSNGAGFCFTSSDCEGAYAIADTICGDGCSGSPLDYTGGAEFVNGDPYDLSDMAFKTIVR